MFSINDFDETLPGPFEWDVKRLVASFAVAGRDRGFDAATRRSINRAVTRAYREAMRSFAGMSNLELWYARIDVDADRRAGRAAREPKAAQAVRAQRREGAVEGQHEGVLEAHDDRRRRAQDRERPAAHRPDRGRGVGRRAGRAGGVPPGVFRSYRRTPDPDRRRLLERYRYVHAARKVVGVGSVGTRAWIVLLLGRDESDPLFLQIKEAQASVLEPFLGKSTFAKHGQRVVEGQRLTQAASDIMLGWITSTPPDGVEPGLLRAPALGRQGLGHRRDDGPARDGAVRGALRRTRSPGRTPAPGDAIAIGELSRRGDSFDRALASFAEAYADQNERDYAALQDAVASGRVAAETDL